MIRLLINKKPIPLKNENYSNSENNYSEKYILDNNKDTIVFSLTCHENYKCVIDLISNIKYYFSDFNIIILLSITENLLGDLKKITDNNIIIVTVRNYNIWGNIYLFYQHILNYQYIKNINFKYFWFVASNELFIKKVTKDFLDNNTIIIENSKNSNIDIKSYYEEFKKKEHNLIWYNHLKKDNYTLKIFEENNITLHWMTHEGMVLPNNIMDEVASFYLKYDFINLSTYKNYPIEEIFVSSYLYSKYNLKNFNTFSFRYNYDNNYKKKKYTQIYNDTLKKPLILSLKPVARKNEDPLRILIRQNNY